MFDGIIGLDAMKGALTAAADNGRVNHCYIFIGAALSGKKTMALAFAKGLLGCDSKNHADIQLLSPQKDSYGVEQVREELLSLVQMKPLMAARRVFIITRADTMTTAAQNAVLKALEDAPKHCMFILTARSNSFLQTILSRAIVMHLPPLTAAQVEGYLLDSGVSHKRAAISAAYAKGAIGRALQIAVDDEFFVKRDFVIDAMMQSRRLSYVEAFDIAKKMADDKDNLQQYLEFFNYILRDILVYKHGGQVWQRDILDVMHSFNIDEAMALSIFKAIESARQYLKQNTTPLLTMEVLMLRILGAV